MYVIQTDMGDINRHKNRDNYYQREVENLQEQVKDLETTLQINKEIIKNLMESQGGTQTMQ
jgi:endonuclease III